MSEARSTPTPTPTPTPAPSAWREPMVWLVFALPAAAVVASVGTAVVALTRPDPVIAVAAGRTPAVQGRNHAATPGATAPRR